MENSSQHTFHIPVMGIAFTVDTPLKVAKYGISSVVSIMDDQLLEQLRNVICKDNGLKCTAIQDNHPDCMAARITAYLDSMQTLIDAQVTEIRQSSFENEHEINNYFEMLPDNAESKIAYKTMMECHDQQRTSLQNELREKIVTGQIDVNIMTKLDKINYDKKGDELAVEYSDAQSALRGFANSKLTSSVVFSAGLNPRLFANCEKFEDFFPNELGVQTKKIILKVSDFRSALIQGKYLAKKGLWVSEFRIESGINCGGHAFISNGILLGPILEELINKRLELYNELWAECKTALISKGKNTFKNEPTLKISAQGGISTSEESDFLRNYYQIDSTGWGSLFLLVPEATNVDEKTLNKLANAVKEDYYLSHASPLGVPYNNFKLSSSEEQRKLRIATDKPGSPCYKKYLSLNTEYTEKPVCTASRGYQNLKIQQLKRQISDVDLLEIEIGKVLEKDCLCDGLGAAALIKNNTTPSHNLCAVNICPGPNLAFFMGVFSLKQMVDHIYGRINILNKIDRPNLFINELQLYVAFLKGELDNTWISLRDKKFTHFINFKENLLKGIEYCESVLTTLRKNDLFYKNEVIQQLVQIKNSLNLIPLLQTK